MANVLVIDDEKLVRLTLRRVLEKQRHVVHEAKNGQLGVEVFAATPGIDLVMTDLIMPDMEGFETIETIRRSAPAIPIIAMSGSGRTDNKDYLKAALHSGATAAIQKPFSVAEVLNTVHACLTQAERRLRDDSLHDRSPQHRK